MLRIKFTYLDILNDSNPLNSASPFYFSTEPLDYDNIYWEPRITDSFEIERFFDIQIDTANRIRTLNVTLDNSDKFFNQFMTSTTTLLNNMMTFYYDNGNGVTKSFTGKIQSVENIGSTISVTVRELGYEYLESTFPDAQIAYDYYSENGINESWNCIPIHFGTVNRIPVSWVNSFYSEYMIGSGPILRVKKVYIDDDVIYDYQDSSIHYKPSKDGREINVRIFRGRGWDAEGHKEYVDDEYHTEDMEPISQGVYRHYSNWGGFAYIQLFSKDDDGFEIPAYPYNTDGALGQVYVDIEGIVSVTKNGNNYVYGNEAVRNPASIIKMLFCNPQLVSDGPCAIGWNYSEDDVDFTQAITDCENLGFKIDGSFDSAVQFSEALKQILYCCRGYVIEENEKITLHIDTERDTSNVSAEFDESGEVGYDCILESYNVTELDSCTNRVRLNYDWSQEFHKYNKKPDVNHESPDYTTDNIYDEILVDETDVLKIQKWNTEEIELKLVSDCSTAHKLAVYYLRKKSRQHISGELQCANSVAMELDAGDLIKITSRQFNWNEKVFQITEISKGSENTTIKYLEYDSTVFDYDDYDFTIQEIAPSQSQVMQALPPVNINLTPRSYKSNNMAVCALDGEIEFNKDGYKLYTVIELADCGTTAPVSNNGLEWKSSITVDGDTFTYDTLTAGHYYKVRAYTRNTFNSSSTYISNAVKMDGNTIPPGVPSLVLESYLKTITANIVLANPPSDLAGFELYRSTSVDGDIVFIANCYTTNGEGKISDMTVPMYDTDYYYTVRAFDQWGNHSAYSERVVGRCSKITSDDVDETIVAGGAVPYAIITVDEIDELF